MTPLTLVWDWRLGFRKTLPNPQYPILRLTSAPVSSSVRVASRREVEMLGTSRSVQVPNPQSLIPNS
ncbi:MAG: hypothetical protein V7L20_16495 [Nostoc sp.]|uniref:hypothetical protein n=1 Tax=Nostoc sp. TaxID=1180 RepID=UPI002FFD4729